MDNKAFVFTGFAFLLVIPAIILAASFFNMMYYGSTGIAISLVSDEVFYSCQNLIDFLQDGSRDGRRDYAIEQVALYANEHGLNYTNVTINTTYFLIVIESPGITCNKTIELRLGTLITNLTLYNWNTTVGGLPVYFRKGTNNITNTSTYVTFSNGTAVGGANVTLDILNESFNGSTVAGYYWKSLNLSNYVDTTDDCTRKLYLGQHTAQATATLPYWYDDSDSESFRILGDISRSTVVGFKPTRNTLGVRITLLDEYDDPVTELICDGVTYPTPTITASIYETSVTAGNLKGSFVAPTNITENSPSGSGIYETSSGVSFSAALTYYAVINATSSYYLPFDVVREISFTDFNASRVYYGTSVSPGDCDSSFGGGSGNRMILNVTNLGTTTGMDYTIYYKYCGVGCTVGDYGTYTTYYNNTYSYPSGKTGRGGTWLACSSTGSAIGGGTSIFANITSVSSPNSDVDLTNNLVNGTA